MKALTGYDLVIKYKSVILAIFETLISPANALVAPRFTFGQPFWFLVQRYGFSDGPAGLTGTANWFTEGAFLALG